MDLAPLLKKCAQGEKLSKEERDCLGSFQLPEPDAEILAENRALQTRLETLEKRFGASENGPEDLESRLEELKASLDRAVGERDAARGELEEARYSDSIGRLAKEKDFADAEYLGYLCKKAGIDPGNSTQVDGFFSELKERAPKLFKIELQPGPECRFPRSGASPTPGTSRDIAELLADAPEISGNSY